MSYQTESGEWVTRWGTPARQAKDYTSQFGGDTDVVVTVRGRSEESSQAIVDGGGLLGMDSHTTRPPAHLPVEFVDWPFREDADPDWERHLEVVRRERPKYAVAPDLTYGRDPREVYDYAARLDQHAETVIVVPKSVLPAETPHHRYRVGLPFQSAFGGFELADRRGDQSRLDVGGGPSVLEDFEGVGPLHVLGGAPSDQLRLRDDVGLQVGSVDGANLIIYARKGRVWTPRGQLSRGNPTWSFYQRVRASVEWLRRAWNPRLTVRPVIEPDEQDFLPDEWVYDPYRSDSPHPCQIPECQRPSVPETSYTYCWWHRDTEPALLSEEF